MIDWDNDLLAPAHRAFGEQAHHYPASGAPQHVPVVFNDRYTSVKFEDGVEIATTQPALNVRASVLSRRPEASDLWRVRGILYFAASVEPDGLGDTRVMLRVATNDEARRVALQPVAP